MRVVDYVSSRISAKVSCSLAFSSPDSSSVCANSLRLFFCATQVSSPKKKYTLIFLYTYVFLVVNNDTVYYTTLYDIPIPLSRTRTRVAMSISYNNNDYDYTMNTSLSSPLSLSSLSLSLSIYIYIYMINSCVYVSFLRYWYGNWI